MSLRTFRGERIPATGPVLFRAFSLSCSFPALLLAFPNLLPCVFSSQHRKLLIEVGPKERSDLACA